MAPRLPCLYVIPPSCQAAIAQAAALAEGIAAVVEAGDYIAVQNSANVREVAAVGHQWRDSGRCGLTRGPGEAATRRRRHGDQQWAIGAKFNPRRQMHIKWWRVSK